ncbi:MFS-type transporter SLC18B1-like [Varroa jacobsoni]|uniref:MFS-type transporter SLC18B1-like n=1 Tax=Varroa jacobsoni TaxID=62625 RepID=UPI000BF89833|nr:MFS-type transporter SLC18B1-like [Varroa jacobsoni]
MEAMCSPDQEPSSASILPSRQQAPQLQRQVFDSHCPEVTTQIWTTASPTKPEKNIRIYWTRERISVLVLTALGCIVQCASYSVLQPFYPQVARQKGNDATEIGIVFSTFPLIGFMSSPLAGKLLSSGIAPKSVLIVGLTIDGVFLSTMGSLSLIKNSTGFFVASMITRLLEAVGFSICLTCYNTMIGAQFPDRLRIMVPLVETVFGFGIMIGPAVGSVLYDIGGYQLPFIVFGACSLTFACLAIVILPNEMRTNENAERTKNTKEKEKSCDMKGLAHPLKIKSLLCEWRVICDILAVFVCCFVIGFNGATLALRTKDLGVSSASQSSLVFLTYGVVYAISSLANGFLSNQVTDCRLLVLLGGVIFCTGLATLGPMPMLPIKPSWWLLMLSQALMGIGNGAIYNLSYVHTLKYVINQLNYPSKAPTYALVASLYSMAFFLGAFLGPFLGGVLFDVVGYRWATTVVLLVVLIPMIPTYPLVIRDHTRGVLQSTPLSREAI